MADLRREVGALTASMVQMIAGQEAHTTLLEALLTAVTELGEDGGGDGLAEALGRIADSLDEQGETLAGMRTASTRYRWPWPRRSPTAEQPEEPARC